MSRANADWVKVGNRFYRKTELYTSVFDPDLELDNYIVTGAPYSGAVGRRRLD
jgi:vacuolar protein sorting-associated protein 16